VLDRDEKTITIDFDGERKKISLDRVKPAHIMRSSETPIEVPVPVKGKTLLAPRKVKFSGKYGK
jgi:hypothetical protein